MRLYHILAAALVCCFLACQKEPEDTLVPTVCKLEFIYYYNNGAVEDTVGIEYNGDQVSRLNYSDYYIVPEFQNDLVTKRNYYLKGTTQIARVDHFTYNPDNTLSRIEAFPAAGGQQSATPIYKYVFSWVGNQLALFEFHMDTSGTGAVELSEEFFTYTGNNISRTIYRELNGGYSDTTNFFYDSKINYYGKNPVLWFTDLLFADLNGLVLPFALSENNVVSLDQNVPGSTIAVTYGETDKQDIESLTIDGDLFSRYKYKCQ
jgi:hypothetical protein